MFMFTVMLNITVKNLSYISIKHKIHNPSSKQHTFNITILATIDKINNFNELIILKI